MKARSTIGYMPLFTNNEYKCIAGGCSGVELIIGQISVSFPGKMSDKGLGEPA